jgi:pimeloyl-ACP methyl ester carboxylesterase
VGVYNATNGMLADLAECVDNILGASTAPAMATLYGDLIKQLRADDSATIEIYAHSQGGLISQEALLRAKETLTAELAPHYGVDGARAEVERRMSRIHVRSFGTAEQGWPSGPMYVHLRNTNDPVPHVIDGAQRDLVGPYDPPEYSQTKAQTFTTPAADLIANHGMKESYIPKLRELRDEGDPSVSDLLDGYDSKNKRCKCE